MSHLANEAKVADSPPERDLDHVAATLSTTFKPFPTVVAAIRKAAGDPRSQAADIARLVESDVGIATDVLRLANAPAAGLAHKCMSVRHAVALLGTKRVCSVVEAAASLAILESAAVQRPEVAAHAFTVAAIARVLAPITGISPDEAFTAGLLHDVGMLVILQSEDPFYEGLLDQIGEGEEPTEVEERALMGYGHGALGAAVLRRWNFPEPLPEVVAFHHDWPAARARGGAVAALVALIRVAEAIAPRLAQEESPSLDELGPLFEEPAFEHLGLTPKELFNLWPGLRRSCDKNHCVGTDEPPPAVLTPRPRAAVAAIPVVVRAAAVSEAPSPSRSVMAIMAALVVVAAAVAVVILA
jgi:putative nucleotidyltransferase with HDIG domain